MFRIRVGILFILLVQLALKLPAQPLPVVCTGEWVRYASTPDPLFQNSQFKWYVTDGVADTVIHNNGNFIDIHWSNVPGRYRIGISEISEHGCVGEIVWSTVDVRGTAIDLGADIELCKGEPYRVNVDGNFSTYVWNDTLISNLSTFEGIATRTDTIVVSATNEDNCSNTDEAVIIVHNLPRVDITANGNAVNGPLTICGNDKVTFDAGSDGLMYDWSTDEHGQTIQVGALPPSEFFDHQYFSVNVTSEFGCKSSDSVNVLRCNVLDTIPGAFSPNGDGINDVWKIPYLEHFPNAVVDVFDRWGNSVFHSEHGYPEPWDGTVNGVPLPTENYFYIIKLDNKSKPRKGNIVIVRNVKF